MSFFDINVSNPPVLNTCVRVSKPLRAMIETTCIPAEHCHPLMFSVSFRMGVGWWFVNSFGKSGVIWLRRLGSEMGRYVSVRHELISIPSISMLRNSSDRPAKTSFFGWGLMCWTFRFCKRPWGQLWPTPHEFPLTEKSRESSTGSHCKMVRSVKQIPDLGPELVKSNVKSQLHPQNWNGFNKLQQCLASVYAPVKVKLEMSPKHHCQRNAKSNEGCCCPNVDNPNSYARVWREGTGGSKERNHTKPSIARRKLCSFLITKEAYHGEVLP